MKTSTLQIFPGDGPMALLNRSHDWSNTSLGDPATWPQSLKTALSILLNSQTPMVLWWGEEQYRFKNDAFAAKLGMHLAHVAGRKAIDGWPEHWHPLIEFATMARTSGEGIAKENFKIELDHHGQRVQTNWALQFSPFQDENGMIAGVLAICHETTPPENYFKHLEVSETRFQNLMRQSPVGMIVLSGAEMKVDIVNEAYGRLVGRTSDELHGKLLFDIIPETKEYYYPILERVRISGEPLYFYEHPYTIESADGKIEGFINLIYLPYREHGGRITGVMVVCQDVTSEVLSKMAISESENRIQSIVTAAPFPLGIYEGENMIITFANDAIIDIYGKGPDVIGRSYYDVLPETRAQGIANELEKVYRTGIPFHARNSKVDIEVEGGTKTYYFNYSFTPIIDRKGKVTGVVNTGADVTDLYRITKQLEENENRFRNLVEEAPIATCLLTGPDFKVEIANHIMLDRWNRDQSVIGKTITEIFPELHDQKFLGILADTYASGAPYEEKGALVRRLRDGVFQDTYVDFNYKPLRNANDEVYAILAMSVDVTESVLVNNKIRESRQQLLASFEQAPTAIAILSGPDHSFVMANEFYGKLVDRPVTDLIGKSLLEALPEIEGQGFDRILDAVVESGTPFIAEEIAVSLLRDDTLQTSYVDLVYQPQFNENNEVVSILVVANDITNQVLSRKKLEETQASLRAAIDVAELATWTYDRNSGIVSFSPRLMEWLGSDVAEKSLDEALLQIPAELREELTEYIDSVFLDSDGIYEREHPIINRNTGEIRIVSTRGQLISDTSGNQELITGIARDVTKERHQQRQLEAEVRKRTDELRLSNIDLANANRSLQESNSALAQFAYVASHDLQEPVRKISFFTELLQSRLANLDEKSASHLEKIQNSADRMSNLIRDILGFSQLAKDGAKFKRTNLNKVMKDVLSDFDLVVEEKGADVVVDDLPAIDAIPLQMTQLFNNLISNALKYSRRDVNPQIRVSATRLDPDEIPDELAKEPTYFKITITDNGIGFDDQYASQIFNIFQRLHGKLEFQGTGIGLAMCKKIAQNHHGAIYATGREGEGSVFTIILPEKQL